MQPKQEYEQVTSKWRYWIYCKLCYILIAVCWQTGEKSEKRLLWLWTKAAMMWDWGSSALDITRHGIADISHCWYDYGYCIVAKLAVITDGRWELATTYCDTIRCHNAEDRPRMFYTLQNARQQHWKHHSDSGQQVSSQRDIALEDCLLKVSVFNIIWHCGFAVGPV